MSLTFLALFTNLAFADDAQYRVFDLADGQRFIGKIIESQASGIEVQLPQGRRLVPFSALAGMQEATAADYLSQPVWDIALSAPPTMLPALKRAAEKIPSVNVWTVGSGWPAANVPIDKQAQAAVCAQDIQCLQTALEGVPDRYIVAANEAGNGARVDAAHTAYRLRASETTASVDDDALYRALLLSLDLEAPKAAPVVRPPSVAAQPSEPRPPQPARERTFDDRFVPLPGYAAFRAGQSQKAWLAAAIAIPATALWVGATGNHAQTPLAHAGLGLAGFCAISVSANHLTLGTPAPASKP